MFQFKPEINKYPAETVTISLLAHKLSNSFPSISTSIALLETILGLRSFDKKQSRLKLRNYEKKVCKEEPQDVLVIHEEENPTKG